MLVYSGYALFAYCRIKTACRIIHNAIDNWETKMTRGITEKNFQLLKVVFCLCLCFMFAGNVLGANGSS